MALYVAAFSALGKGRSLLYEPKLGFRAIALRRAARIDRTLVAGGTDPKAMHSPGEAPAWQRRTSCYPVSCNAASARRIAPDVAHEIMAPFGLREGLRFPRLADR